MGLDFYPPKSRSKSSSPPGLQLSTPVQYLKGVGPKLGELLRLKGIHTVEDLLWTLPRAYEDRRAARSIRSLKEGEVVSLKAMVVGVKVRPLGARRIFTLVVRDASGVIGCQFFRAPFRGYFEAFQPGLMVRVLGTVVNYRGTLQFTHPEVRLIKEEEPIEDALVPIYSESEGLPSQKMRQLVQVALKALTPPEEILPAHHLQNLKLMTRWQALQAVHTPDPAQSELYQNLQSPAQHRLIFDEFFDLELFLLFQKEQGKVKTPTRIRPTEAESLPFALTQAQQRVLREIHSDLASGRVMNRLVQGDVGSGKTIVAFLSVLSAVRSGFQGALMAPTEILAEQHQRNAEKILAPLGVRIGFLVGSTKAREREALLMGLRKGEIDFLIGTHALIEDPVTFSKLGLVVIDEQHRFGVEQRLRLLKKGTHPHALVMTATPIPRTLALTAYGDLEVSVIDELPPGRQAIQTKVVSQGQRGAMWKWIAEQVQRGRQAYVVYPLVEESEKVDLKNAVEEFEKLQTEFPQFAWGLMHGRLSANEKDEIMQRFRKGELQVLVSTTVIEVGVDVPNANIMVIEHAERFGLSQLHQLRGRVGRGEWKSYCFLVPGFALSGVGAQRLHLMETTQDGFKIAEADLELRGPGEVLGTRQSGLLQFRIASLIRDQKILDQARYTALQILQDDPQLGKIANSTLRAQVLRQQQHQLARN